jgi:hypothetical protein
MNLSLPSLGRSRPSLVGNRLLAALTLGIAAAALVPSVEAGVVTINLTDTRNDGTTTTDDTIAGVNAGVTQGGAILISNWLGVGSGDLRIYNGGFRASFQLKGFELENGAVISYLTGGYLTLFSGGDVVDSSDFGNPLSPYSFFRLDTIAPIYAVPAISPNTSYVGFRLGFGPSSYNYGYLGVSWDGSSNFQITSGAYETTAGQSITIPGGGGSSVPDSGSTGLMGLLFAGAAVRQWRKSRR